MRLFALTNLRRIDKSNTMNQVQYWRDPRFAGIETCRVVHSRHVFPDHAHEGIYAIGLMEEGGSYCLGELKSEAVVHAGQIALINPGQVHSGVPVGRRHVTYRMLYVDEDLVQTAARDLQERPARLPEFRRVVVDDPQLQGRLMQLCRRIAHPGDPMETETLLLDAMARLLAHYSGMRVAAPPATGRQRALRRAMEFMSADLERNVSLEAVACQAGMSRYHFMRVFKQATGLSPHRFRTLRRLDFAKQRLRLGLPPAQVALETGFVDQSHLTHKFRQLLGATPGQYLSARKP